MLHISKLKSYKNNAAEQNERIKRLNNEILELVQDEELDNEMNNTFLFNDKIYGLVSKRLRLASLYHLHLIQHIPVLLTYILFLLTPRTTTILTLNFQNRDTQIQWETEWVVKFLDQFSTPADSKTNILMLLNLYLKGVFSKMFKIQFVAC